MVKKSALCLFLILLFIPSVIIPQEQEKIDLKKNELSGLKTEIEKLESELDKKTEKEKESFESFENYSRQNYLLHKVINKLKAEEKSKQTEINKSNDQISSLNKEILKLRKNYAKYVVAIYKYGKTDELASVFDAVSVEQAFLRYKYLNRFSEKRHEDLEEYQYKIEELNRLKAKLEEEKVEKKSLADQKQKEENGLLVKLKQRKKILNAIKNDKASLKKELEAKKTAELKIKQMITKLIADAELKRKEAEKLADLNKEPAGKLIENIPETSSPGAEYNFDLSTSSFSSFSNLKGKLNWPVLHGKIIKKFGENINNKLNTVTLNYGVDIEASSDLDVKSVADGVVSAIDWIPGYGSVVIITHKEDYRTVYSHLSELYISEGDKVKMGSLIGRVGESLEGNILHFEIWSSRSNQNPETWLVRK